MSWARSLAFGSGRSSVWMVPSLPVVFRFSGVPRSGDRPGTAPPARRLRRARARAGPPHLRSQRGEAEPGHGPRPFARGSRARTVRKWSPDGPPHTVSRRREDRTDPVPQAASLRIGRPCGEPGAGTAHTAGGERDHDLDDLQLPRTALRRGRPRREPLRAAVRPRARPPRRCTAPRVGRRPAPGVDLAQQPVRFPDAPALPLRPRPVPDVAHPPRRVPARDPRQHRARRQGSGSPSRAARALR